MKKVKLIFIFVLLFFGTNIISALDTSEKIYDYADILNDQEETQLKILIDDYIEKFNMDMVFVSIDNHTNLTTKAYAEDFYDYNDFGIGDTNDGVLFVIDFTFGYRDIYMLTTGNAILTYDDYRIDRILDNVENNSSREYYYWYEAFVNSSTYYASMGIPSSNQNVHINSNGDPYTINWVRLFLVSAILPSIIIIIFVLKNKMVRKKMDAQDYLIKDSLSITTKSDRFISSHTSSVKIRDNSSSSGSSPRVGGSSVSRGSSGISHGGGGRRL